MEGRGGGRRGHVSNFKNTNLYLTQTAPELSWRFEERFTLGGRDVALLAQDGTIQKGKELRATTLKMLLVFKEDWAAAATASAAAARGSEAQISLGW